MDGVDTYNSFLAMHKPQLLLSKVPEYFWPTLCKKLKDQIFDSGLTFQLVQIDYEDGEKMPYDPLWSVMAITDIDRSDPTHIYLVDHAWTFRANRIKSSLQNMPELLQRMCAMMQISADSTEEQIELVSQKVWKYAHTYSIANNEYSVEERVPIWYVLDELGSGITHSDTPNFKAVPFINISEQMTYTLLFPIENVEQGDVITRDFAEGFQVTPMKRDALLIPWRHYNHFDEDFSQEEPDKDYFLDGHIAETLPELDILKNRQRPEKLKVFSEYRYINDYLNAPEFEIVDNAEEADVLWFINHFKTFKELSEVSPNKFVNQFPYEYVITIKDLLAIVARRSAKQKPTSSGSLETYPLWLPTTYNLKTELPQLVAYYMQRKRAGLDNHWICKPYNLARSIDTYITNSLDFICRLPLTGPKIAQKYIDNPVLFDRPDIGMVKFDIRYVILLKSVDPTEVYVYNNFFLRFSNKPFALNNLEDYEQHFTVMNYTEGAPLYRLLCEEFKQEWSKQYANYDWDAVEKSIFQMISELFVAATVKNAPCGIAKSPQSRALYAADIMLSWHQPSNDLKIQPKLLEVNWMPDCQRACEYYPNFYNDIFSVMFLDKDVSTCTKVL
ncbi:tubulin--tyrosine ligase-like protein 12 [Ostrinia nubilalis]|uniref:tubulin--tyrosine ligase-like protein 12 n=1 Tax=Ostrinia nubilalis TaxID=29057 RepID=UPI0030823383